MNLKYDDIDIQFSNHTENFIQINDEFYDIKESFELYLKLSKATNTILLYIEKDLMNSIDLSETRKQS